MISIGDLCQVSEWNIHMERNMSRPWEPLDDAFFSCWVPKYDTPVYRSKYRLCMLDALSIYSHICLCQIISPQEFILDYHRHWFIDPAALLTAASLMEWSIDQLAQKLLESQSLYILISHLIFSVTYLLILLQLQELHFD